MNSQSHTIILEHCPLCGSAESKPYAQYKEFTWVSCACGLVYKRSVLAELMSNEIYDSAYFKAGDGKHAHDYDRRTRRRVKKSRIQIMDTLRYTRPGPLLDIGCSLGYTLQAAKDLGLSGYGIDIAQYAVDKCREQGLKAEIGDLENIPYPDKTFRLIVMKHVVEHTPHPKRALKEVYRACQPGGAIFIAVPHAGYIKAQFNPEKSRFFRPDSKGGNEHYVYYTPATLSQLLEEAGFCVQKIHPHLLHTQNSLMGLAGGLLMAPFKLLGSMIKNVLHLRKEFWLIAGDLEVHVASAMTIYDHIPLLQQDQYYHRPLLCRLHRSGKAGASADCPRLSRPPWRSGISCCRRAAGSGVQGPVVEDMGPIY